VADLAYMVAREMGLSEHEARQVELAGLLHDIGKIGIPDRILTKPGGLDTEERLIMMSHADMGARIVERSSALAHLTPIVRHHHEWYDGRGYPDGLRGDEIPLSAAILGVADALETMTSNRVYRRALPLEQARLEIERGRGSQFHPRAADVVLRLMDTNPVVMELLESAQSAHSGSANLAPIRSSDVVALRVLNRIAEEIGALTELDLFLDHVHGILREELDIADVIIWLQDEENKAYMLAAGTAGLPSPTNLEPLRQRDATPASFASEISTMLRRSDELGPNSVICPMFVEDSLVGMIELVLHSADVVDDRDIDLLQAIAAPVASTIRVAQLHDHAKRAARTDGLTGVLNHRTFYQELDRRMSSISGDDEVHLLIIDVIGLKATNDNYGHVAGDRALRTIAQELVKRVRAEDIVSRYGGDEFAIILQGPLDTPVESIIERIEQPVMCELDSGPILSIRLRCGHAVSNAREGRATELVARADALLYARVRPTERGAA
jgi:diguanylate cyclase (GGDEF)-like protein/putative nucleotidyltransferase with HDIG domain